MDIFIVIISTYFIMQLLYSLFTTGMMTDLWHLASVTLPEIDMGNFILTFKQRQMYGNVLTVLSHMCLTNRFY